MYGWHWRFLLKNDIGIESDRIDAEHPASRFLLMTTKSSKCSSSHLSVKIKEVKVDQAVAESC